MGDLGLCIGLLWEGCIKVEKAKMTMLPLPYMKVGDVSATLQFANGTELEIASRAVECTLKGDEKFAGHGVPIKALCEKWPQYCRT